jgi:ketosteroid isomerase-like protein
MKRSLLPILLISCAAASACNKQTGASPAAADTAAIAGSIKAGEAQWVQDYRAKDVAKALAHYAPDASLMPSGMAPMHGSKSIEAGLKGLIADPAFDLNFSADNVRVAASGDLAYTRGTYSLRVTDPKTRKPITDKGSYVTVYAKQADGSWKAVDDIVASSQPAG